jgi:hypothetical protein
MSPVYTDGRAPTEERSCARGLGLLFDGPFGFSDFPFLCEGLFHENCQFFSCSGVN